MRKIAKFIESLFYKIVTTATEWHKQNLKLKKHRIDCEIQKKEIERKAKRDLLLHEEVMAIIQITREESSIGC